MRFSAASLVIGLLHVAPGTARAQEAALLTHVTWSEEYQASVYRHQVAMLERIPFLRGVTPWILSDFRSPRRPLPGIQDFWNRKGLVSERGIKKQAFFVLQQYYRKVAETDEPRQ